MAHERETNPIVGTGGKIFVHSVTLDNVAVTTADSTAWSITTMNGTVDSSGTLSYVSSLPVDGYESYGGWYANILWPDEPGKYHVHFTITKSSVPMKWHHVQQVDAFR